MNSFMEYCLRLVKYRVLIINFKETRSFLDELKVKSNAVTIISFEVILILWLCIH